VSVASSYFSSISFLIISFHFVYNTGNVNAVHMVQFVEAEIAALRGDTTGAMTSYNQCISSAARNGCLNDRALAHERAGLFCLDHDDFESAAYNLHVAVKVYQHWGANAKVDQILKEHGHLIAQGCGKLSIPTDLT